MNIKAIFPSGASELIVHGLHQWDYGRKLEIRSDDLPALIEVHFACAGMTEAVVRSCNVVQGVAEATIPDQCLEQTTPIVAWVYEVGESSGATIKTITLTVIQRARPQPAGPVPTVLSDKYTELMAAVNEQVAALRAGNVTVARALTADKATEATKAATANKATEADWAKGADKADAAADAAVADVAGEARLADVSKKMEIPNTLIPEEHTITQPGLYMVEYYAPSSSEGGGVSYTDIIFVPYLNVRTACSVPGYRPTSGAYEQEGVVYRGDTQTFSIKNGVGNEYITKIWLLATEYQGE